MKRPGYREALEWIVVNDDCHWLAGEEIIPSVSACLIRDLFDVEDNKLYADIRRSLKRFYAKTDRG
jgi:hypothetical protein